jgi:hypothetical protein
MPVFYKIDKERRLVLSTILGVITLADGLTQQEKLRNDPDFDPSFSQLMDYTHVVKFDFSTDDVRKFAQHSVFSSDSRRAMLVNGDLAFGLARMFETFRESLGEKGIRVFRNLEEALDWVLAKNSDG